MITLLYVCVCVCVDRNAMAKKDHKKLLDKNNKKDEKINMTCDNNNAPEIWP